MIGSTLYYRLIQIRNVLFATIFLYTSLQAQKYTVNYQSYGVEDGLLHREVNAILQDSKHFIWIVTKQGLNRFDGYHFKAFTVESQGFLNRSFIDLAEDADGLLWLLPRQPFDDFDIWDPASGDLTNFKKKFSHTKGIENISLTESIVSSPDRTIFLGMENPGGIIRYRPDEGIQLIVIPEVNHLQILAIGSDNHVWCLADNHSILELDACGNILQKFTHPGEITSLPKNQNNNLPFIYGVSEKAVNGSIKNVTFLIDEKGVRKSLNIPSEDLYYLKTRSTSIEKDLIWTKRELYDLDGKMEQSLTASTKSLLDKKPRCFLQDLQGNLWVGTNYGLHYFQIRKDRFNKYLNKEKILEDGNHEPCRGILVQNEQLLVNHELLGLLDIDLQTGKFEQIQPKPSEGNYHALTALKNGQVVSCSNKALYFFQGKHLEFKQKTDFETWSLLEVSPDQLWLGTTKGLIGYNYSNHQLIAFEQYNEFKELSSATIYYLGYDNKGVIWICTDKGLYAASKNAGIQARYWKGGKGKFQMPADAFFHFRKDTTGRFWLATDGGGIIRWSQEEDNYLQYTQAEGLSNDVIYSVYEDKHNHLWMSSDFGIMRFDKLTGQIKTYLEKDGISYNEFNKISHYQDEKGHIYFGGINGITAFDPEDFQKEADHPDPPLTILSFQQFNGTTNRLEDRTAVLEKTREIILYPSDRYFQLEFALLSFQEARQNRYAYLIKGIHDEWQYQSENMLRFGRLSFGTYELHIKAQDVTGKWSKNELVLTIQVVRPYYLKTWFFVLLGLVLFSIAQAYLIWRNFNLKKMQLRLENEVALQTKTIRLQSEELRHLDNLKSRFFTNASHELRTPLTLILAPIGTVLKSGKLDKKNFDLLKTSQKNSQKLLQLINEFLDLSKLDSGKLELNESFQSMQPLLHRLVSQFESYALDKEIDLSFAYLATPDLQVNLDVQKFEIIFNNLLSNALKFTSTGGKIMVSFHDTGNLLRLMVIDTGSGIHPDDLPHVFDRFFQSKKQDAPAQGGSGIGLALCHEYAVLFGGKITVESVYHQGCTFNFEFPKKEKIINGEPENIKSNEEEKIGFDSSIKEMEIQVTEFQDKVLIVEDNFDLRQFIQVVLADQFEVVCAENGQVALDILDQTNGEHSNEKPVNLIISDIMMPVMDGFQLLEKLKSSDRYWQIPVIILTAVANLRDKLRALRIGVDDYLLKPFDQDELKVRAASLVQNYRQRIAIKEYLVAGEEKVEPIVNQQVHTVENQQWLSDLENMVLTNIHHYSLSADFIALKLAMSRRQFFRRIKELTGKTPNEYINEVRFNHARKLLEDRIYRTVKEVSHAVGMRDSFYFSQQFRAHFGKQPSSYL